MIGFKRILVVLAAAMAAVSTNATAGDRSDPSGPIPAVKIDSGLGELPVYTEWKEPWLYATPAESVDDGLGAMPDVSRIQEVWLYAHPAEKLDSGLGDLTRATLQARVE
jgi:hypothetical protein